MRMTEHAELVQTILKSDLPRESKLAELSKLILGADEPATVPELFAALRGFGPTAS